MTEIVARSTVGDAGLVANHVAVRSVFGDYKIRKSKNTLRSHLADLGTFSDYLCAVGTTYALLGMSYRTTLNRGMG